MITARELIQKFQMEPHPEGGFYKRTFLSDSSSFSSILFMLVKNNFSAFHRIKSDEQWNWYYGDNIIIHEIDNAGNYHQVKLSDNDHFFHFQHVVKGGNWFASECIGEHGFALCGCTVVPAFNFDNFELAKQKELIQLYPQHREIIERLTRKPYPKENMQEIKIHQPIIDAVIVCLKAVFEEGKVADKEVSSMLKLNKNFGSRDRSMIAESVYDIVRWKLKYAHQLETYNPAFSMYKHLILVSLLNRNYSIKNPELFEVSTDDITSLLKVIEQSISEKYIEQSYPETLYNFCIENIGEQWHSLAEALNKKPSVFIRVNTLKTTTEELCALLEKLSVTFKVQGENCIEILSKNNLKKSDLYNQGLFEFQDIGSQAIGNFLFDAISDKSKLKDLIILDVCAGAGGKSLHLSALLNNEGTIYVTDYKASRLKNLQQRAEQAGCRNVKIIDFKDAKKIKNPDFILIDAPCSGTGTFKRQADLKYKVTPEKINEYQTIQASLLNEYKNLLNKNGKIIYATCSILPQENQLQIKEFIKNNSSFKLEKETQLLPTEYDGDGFYMALLSHK